MKQCSRCQLSKPISEFGKYKRGINGIHPRCKVCCREVHNIWTEKNRDYVNEKSRQWTANNIEKKRQTALNWYRRNQKENNRKSRERAQANKELYAQRKKAWQKANPEKVRAQTERRRIRKLENLEYFISDKELIKLYRSPCIYCGSTKRITLDHIIPISRGGTHGIGNIAAACISCNSSKRDKTITEWRKLKR